MTKSRGLGLLSTALVAMVASGVTIVGSQYLPLPKGDSSSADDQIEKVVASYIENNPQAIIDSLQNWQLKAESRRAQQQSDAVKQHKEEFVKSGVFPEIGNPKGDVVVVEFYDYNCPACKALFEGIDKLVNEDKNVRILMGEFPIFGPVSDKNAKIALAVYKLGGSDAYLKFHTTMMRHKGKANEPFALDTAKGIGLDRDEVKKEANKPEYTEQLAAIRDFAKKLQVRGTPAIIVGDRMFNGAIDYDALKTHVGWAREEKGDDAEASSEE